MNAEEIGRSVIRVYLHAREYPPSNATSYVGVAIKAGRAMDFAARIRRQATDLDSHQLMEYARLVGMDASDMLLWALPAMKRAGVIEYKSKGGLVIAIEEFVGVQAPFQDQVAAVWQEMGPQLEEVCALDSVGLASYAPLTVSDHQHILSEAGHPEELQAKVLPALDALSLLNRAPSQTLGEDILFNEYVWGTSAVKIAEFLKSLPATERGLLTSLSARALNHPGATMDEFGVNNAKLVQAARQVGFLDPIEVSSLARPGKYFAFHPALERQLAIKGASDSLHERKSFVAHILFGHRYGFRGTGRIENPVVLVQALIAKGAVGPASAIASDYPLIEALGIARVRPSRFHAGRAYLELVKTDVAKDSLDLLRLALEDSGESGNATDPLSSGLWTPSTYAGPERIRVRGELKPGPEKELFDATIAELRKRARRQARLEDIF